MIDLHLYLYNKIKEIIDRWDLSDTYSITFFVYANEGFEYDGVRNLTCFNISQNTESYFENEYNPKEDFGYMVKPDKYHSMQRWSYAYLEGEEFKIFDDESYSILLKWYEQNGIENIGYEDDEMFDKCIGPVGYQEVLDVIAEVGKRLQEEEYLKEKCGTYLPIIIQDYEFMDCVVEATKKVNIHGEAKVFLESL